MAHQITSTDGLVLANNRRAWHWIQHVRPARLSAEAAFASDKWGAGAEAKRTAMKTALALL
jgi:hypothetical protein